MKYYNTKHVFSYTLDKSKDEGLSPEEVLFRFWYALSGVLGHSKHKGKQVHEILGIEFFQVPLILKGQKKISREEIKKLDWKTKLPKFEGWEKFGEAYDKYEALLPPKPAPPNKGAPKVNNPKHKFG